MQHCCVKINFKMKTSRNTVAKTTILDLLTTSKVALSHIEIQNATIGICDRVTIYRVLERLLKEDLIHKAVNIEGVTKYASCNIHHKNHSHSHVHFSCESCRLVTCLENVKPVFTLPDNYKVNEVNFTLTGICSNCN